MNLLVVGLTGLLIITYLASLNWRRAVVAVLVIAILEGAIRKWVLPQASQLIYFLKDFVLLGAYLSYFSLPKDQRRLLVKHSTILALLGLSLTWGLFQALNPSLGSPVIGFFGIKSYFFYIPLIWMLPSLFRTEDELYRFLRAYSLLIIPVGLLAIAQFFSPPDSPLNVYAWQEDTPYLALGGDLKSVRVTGTFSYIAGYSVYMAASLCLLLPLMTRNQPKLWRWLTIVELAIIVLTSFMNGSRGLLLIIVLLFLGYVGVQVVSNTADVVRVIKKFALPGLLTAGVIGVGFQSAVNSFWLRVTSNQDINGRILSSYLEPFTNFHYKELDGYGIGATFQANGILRALLGLPPGEPIPVFFESEMGRIALEIGPLGFLLWYGIKVAFLVALWQVYRRLHRPFLKQLALSALLLQMITFSSQIAFNHTAGIYHWFFNGFIFLLPQIEQIAIWQDYYQQFQPYERSPVARPPYQ